MRTFTLAAIWTICVAIASAPCRGQTISPEQLALTKSQLEIEKLVEEVRALKAANQASAASGRGQAAAPDPHSEERTQLEIAKLTEEVQELKETNLAIGRSTKAVTAWLAACGGGVTTILVAIIGLYVNRNQKRRLRQEDEIAREKHFLELFRSLGDKSERVRLGAICVILGRIAELKRKRESEASSQEHEKTRSAGGQRSLLDVLAFRKNHRQARASNDAEQLRTLVGILVNATKSESAEVLQKYVSDGLVEALGARRPPGPPLPKESPLAEHDFQGAKLTNAWWADVDARGVDFYRASLTRAGMRRAHLSRAVLKHADLTKACLAQAQLDNANLMGATLVGADLTGTNLEGADLRDADLRGADLRGANLRNAKLDRANREGAHFDDGIPVPAVPT